MHLHLYISYGPVRAFGMSSLHSRSGNKCQLGRVILVYGIMSMCCERRRTL